MVMALDGFHRDHLARRGSFSDPYCQPGGVPGGKAQESPLISRLWTPGISHFYPSLHWASSNLSELPVPTSLLLLQLLLQVNRSQLYFLGCIYLSRFQGGNLPHYLNFMIGPSKLIDFQFVHFFLLVRMGTMISKIFTCQSWDQSASLQVLLFIS